MAKAVVFSALLGILVAGCARSHTDSAGSVRITGASGAQVRVLRSILERMGPTGIASLAFGTSRDGQPLLSAEYADEHDAHAEWTSSLVAAGFNEEARDGGAKRVEVFKNGAFGSVIPVGGGDPAIVPTPDLSSIRHALATVIKRQGGRLVDL